MQQSKIIEIRKSSFAKDPGKPWGDTLAFAENLLKAFIEENELKEIKSLSSAPKDKFINLMTVNGEVSGIWSDKYGWWAEDFYDELKTSPVCIEAFGWISRE